MGILPFYGMLHDSYLLPDQIQDFSQLLHLRYIPPIIALLAIGVAKPIQTVILCFDLMRRIGSVKGTFLLNLLLIDLLNHIFDFKKQGLDSHRSTSTQLFDIILCE